MVDADLLDVTHSADWLMRKAREEIDADRPTIETLERLVALILAATFIPTIEISTLRRSTPPTP